MPSDKEKVANLLPPDQKSLFQEYASLTRQEREAVHRTQFERPDIAREAKLSEQLDAATEVIKTQLPLIESLRQKEAKLVSSLQNIAEVCATTIQNPDKLNPQSGIHHISHVILELNREQD